ncbi:imidazolonepropionase [Sphingomonas sp. TX0543]|uniref:imidazolonepropionase n=1 Tax=Sphingomonas sp. TX0543 TaxID=3399682 RepID=UPI003AFB6D38
MSGVTECDTVWMGARLATMIGAGLGAIDDGMIAARAGRIIHVGPSEDARAFAPAKLVQCEGRLVTPGLIDCHTHLIHAGDRSGEFEARLRGASYEEIARAGGGIVATMRATRAASQDELVRTALPRLDALIAEGVTTIEIKSGYGLNLESERQMLRAAQMLAAQRPVQIISTFLGAHAVPPEYAGDPDGYVALVADTMLPTLAAEGLVDAVDAFCEGIGFSASQAARVLEAARALRLPVKLHAEQLSNLHGAALAAKYDALSADHLEYLDNAGVAAMAASGTVATLLPGAFYLTRETKLPPIAALRNAGVPIALATDCNPGTSPLTSILLVLNMAATCFGLTVEEALRGVTVNAARALGRLDVIGTLEAGKRCDLAIWDVGRPAELVYRMGLNPLHARIWSGR